MKISELPVYTGTGAYSSIGDTGKIIINDNGATKTITTENLKNFILSVLPSDIVTYSANNGFKTLNQTTVLSNADFSSLMVYSDCGISTVDNTEVALGAGNANVYYDGYSFIGPDGNNIISSVKNIVLYDNCAGVGLMTVDGNSVQL